MHYQGLAFGVFPPEVALLVRRYLSIRWPRGLFVLSPFPLAVLTSPSFLSSATSASFYFASFTFLIFSLVFLYLSIL